MCKVYIIKNKSSGHPNFTQIITQTFENLGTFWKVLEVGFIRQKTAWKLFEKNVCDGFESFSIAIFVFEFFSHFFHSFKTRLSLLKCKRKNFCLTFSIWRQELKLKFKQLVREMRKEAAKRLGSVNESLCEEVGLISPRHSTNNEQPTFTSTPSDILTFFSDDESRIPTIAN